MISAINVFMIIISIMTFCLKTSKELYVTEIKFTSINTTTLASNNSTNTLSTVTTGPSPAFTYIDAVSNAWFTLVILMRFAVSPDRLDLLLLSISSY